MSSPFLIVARECKSTLAELGHAKDGKSADLVHTIPSALYWIHCTQNRPNVFSCSSGLMDADQHFVASGSKIQESTYLGASNPDNGLALIKDQSGDNLVYIDLTTRDAVAISTELIRAPVMLVMTKTCKAFYLDAADLRKAASERQSEVE